jgi:predicted RNase H-like HicB family nuclease
MAAKRPKDLQLFGYVKQEDDGRFAAICVNLALAAQGKTSEEALHKLMKEIRVYLDHIAEKHPDEWDKYTNRMAPREFIEEFKEGLDLLREAVERRKKRTTSKKKNIGINRFVQTFSTPYPQASM